MDSLQTLCTVGGLICAIASGYMFGGSVPSWEDDAANDYLPGELSTNAAEYGWGGRGEVDLTLLRGCLSPFFRLGKLGGIVTAVAALVLIYVFSGLGGSDTIFDLRFLLLVGGVGLGYLVAVLTDKGPVGPLQ